MNAQAIIPPSTSDIDGWEQLGNEGWNWKTLEPYIKKPFSVTKADQETADHLSLSWADKLGEGSEGPLKASFPGVKEDPIGKAWVETFTNLGFPLTDTPFSGTSTGPFNVAATVDPVTKTRSYSYTAYYKPVADRPNLHVLTETEVEKVVLEQQSGGLVATGIQFLRDGDATTISAKKEVIVSAGALNSPKVLELSGIGDPKVLEPLGIDVKVPNEFVGTNLQDHIMTPISYEAAEGVKTLDGVVRGEPAALGAVMQEYQAGKGPLCSSGVTSIAYLPTADFKKSPEKRDEFLKWAESQISNSHPLDSARFAVLRRVLESGNQGTAQFFILPAQIGYADNDTTPDAKVEHLPENFLSPLVALSHPLSTGTVHISSRDPSVKATANHNYFSNPVDIKLHARHVRYLEKLAATAPLSNFIKPDGKRNHPAAFIGDDLEKAEKYAAIASSTNWHSSGTCAMAPKEKGGVVNAKLQVYDGQGGIVKGLRVCDASVFPIIPQSNTMILTYAVAERLADLIKNDQ